MKAGQASAGVCTDAEWRISYALAKQVPDMERGFAIATNYGDITFESGPGAERIRKAVEKELQRQLKKLEKSGGAA